MQLLGLLPFAAILGAASAHFPHCTPRDLSVLSCHNTSAVNTCCSEYPSGILLLAQYWAPGWNSSLGPATSWTLHGLWPDFCDGTYPAYCDETREYADPVELVKERDYALWKWMNEYWVDVEGYEEGLWKHEWDKHGTCMSTLEPGCYGRRYEVAQEEVDFFRAAAGVFKTLDTYKFLKRCGIIPSETVTYTKTAVVECLTEAFGSTPFIGCDAQGRINELWYYHYLRGKILGGSYEHTETTRQSSCPDEGIWYLPK